MPGLCFSLRLSARFNFRNYLRVGVTLRDDPWLGEMSRRHWNWSELLRDLSKGLVTGEPGEG